MKSKIRSKKTNHQNLKSLHLKNTSLSRKKVTSKGQPKEMNYQTSQLSLSDPFNPRIKVIGVGGGGGSIVSEIGKSLHKSATFIVADTDVRSLKKKQGIKYFRFGKDLTHGLGTGLNAELAREAAINEKEKISELFRDQDIVIFVACLGGGLGSGATPIFLESAKDFSGITLGIFTLPFKFEGKNKSRIAAKALKELRKLLNVSITIPNERIFRVIDENTAITQAFSMVNKSLIQSLESLIHLIKSPGLINIDFADLRAILQGRGNMAFLNTAEAVGKDRAEQVVKKVLNNPLYQDNFIPEKVLFNIEGSNTLSMFEVDKISKAISEQNKNAKIIFGISRNQKQKNKIKTTLLMTGGGSMVEGESNGQKAKKTVSKKVKIKSKKVTRRSKQHKSRGEEERGGGSAVFGSLNPVFGGLPAETLEVKKISISDKMQNAKKTIRRTALEIKEAEDIEKSKKTKQEEEWEIPAFLRFKR